MADSFDVESMLALKRAGVERMQARQQRVHERLAAGVENHPEVVPLALARVREQLAAPMFPAQLVYREWERILMIESVSYVAAILRDVSATTEQLRGCAPFTLCDFDDDK